MKILFVERRGYPAKEHEIWTAEASILVKHSDSASVLLVVGDAVCKPDSHCLRKASIDRFTGRFDLGPQCIGLVEGSDQDLSVLAKAGYDIADLRNISAPELLKLL
jgi:hypothetical protein